MGPTDFVYYFGSCNQTERHGIHSSELAAHEVGHPIVNDTKGKRPQQRGQKQPSTQSEQAKTQQAV